VESLGSKTLSAPRGNDAFTRPYVISWNLTYRCNLACEHCYLDAGGTPEVRTEAFADRSELGTEECLRLVDEIAAFAPEALLILTGGEPLLRRDILQIVRRASQRALWVVVGTNGVSITSRLAELLRCSGARGLALSLDALDPGRHDAFRRVRGAWQNTVDGARILRDADLPFIVQTTVGAHNAEELAAIADFAHDRLGARVWNLYFLVQTGRGAFASDISAGAYDRVLDSLTSIQERYRGRMVVNAKCAPHYVRRLLADDPSSSFLKTYAGGAGGCPAGTHYMGIRPNGDVTPCPYLPVFGGNLRSARLAELWQRSEPFVRIRERNRLGGRCGACELTALCGGCRARAYGTSGDYLAEDPLCTHEPGTLADAVAGFTPAVEYGRAAAETIAWDPDARSRVERVPAFVRGMVVRAVESHCRAQGLGRVTAVELERIRERMPTTKLFRRPPTSD
jgi:radical SAM protein with 4Fe4S-binding SPASM domain